MKRYHRLVLQTDEPNDLATDQKIGHVTDFIAREGGIHLRHVLSDKSVDALNAPISLSNSADAPVTHFIVGDSDSGVQASNADQTLTRQAWREAGITNPPAHWVKADSGQQCAQAHGEMTDADRQLAEGARERWFNNMVNSGHDPSVVKGTHRYITQPLREWLQEAKASAGY